MNRDIVARAASVTLAPAQVGIAVTLADPRLDSPEHARLRYAAAFGWLLVALYALPRGWRLGRLVALRGRRGPGVFLP